jgi:glycosyltransferase involved in cell wall biosynthesis
VNGADEKYADQAPAVSVVLPTFNNAATLPATLTSLRRQRYPGKLEVIVVDGGSSDTTRTIARDHGAQIIENPGRIQELGIPIGIEAAAGPLVLLLDADDELPHDGWLVALLDGLGLADDIVSADSLYHCWRPEDPPIVRLGALIGGSDPIAIDLGWSDRWGYHYDRWTGMPVGEDDHGTALVVRLDPDRVPPMGSNGVLVRREALLAVRYRPFVHPEVVAQLADAGWRFARVRECVIHHFAPDLASAVRKVRRRTRRTVREYDERAHSPRPSPARVAALTLYSLTLVGPALRAARGYRRRPDVAWCLYPLWHALWTLSYIWETLDAGGWRASLRALPKPLPRRR